MSKNSIYVTQPFLPPLDEFSEYLQKIWNSKTLTNNGPYHQELEQKLCEYLGVSYISLFSNGTQALITALQALKIKGEVITTPFSFVATSHALWWNNIKPVFSDIEPLTFTLDPERIEESITPNTTAILPVHVYGNPCKVDKIKDIADKHGLKLLYDAAHAFGVTLNGNSVANFGDLSILSFHATKVFNTFEGGAIVCHDKETKIHIDHLKNFGFTNETTVEYAGINAKMNEFQAALGILQLKYVDAAIEKRRKITKTYREAFKRLSGITFLNDIDGVRHNYGYFPILVDPEKFGITREELYNNLRRHNIFGRRYFYPLISQFPTYRELDSAKPGRMPVAEKIAESVICLPIYPDLELEDIDRILNILNSKKL
jgi:dTDP-4-amino-4,6-dideoxygalactose transaminase